MPAPTSVADALRAHLSRIAALSAVLFALATATALAQGAEQDSAAAPALLNASEITVDEELGIVSASGRVELIQGERILRADRLSYNRRLNFMTATGSVSMVDPNGEVMFAEFVELTGDLREGAMRHFRMIVADQSRFAAVTAQRADGTRTVMRRAAYTPCEPCAKDPTRAPAWQIRADRIEHDQGTKEVVYRDATLEVAGVPVFYTPYFSHADGSEKRKSGFLAPDISDSSTTGTMVATPYFWALTPSSDVTLTPIVQSKDRPILAAEYRERVRSGELRMEGSLLQTNRTGEGFPKSRGHARGSGRFDVDNDWRWGFDFARATDKTYLDRYRLRQRFAFFDQNSLESRLYTEGFRDRGYAVVNAFAFQSLRPEDSPGLTPYALPAASYSWLGEPGAAGGRFGFDSSAVSIYRRDGLRSQRATMVNGWTLPHTTQTGEIYTLTASLQADAIHAGGLMAGSDPFQPTENGFSTRFTPQIALTWRFPLVRRDGALRTTIEPIAGTYISPRRNGDFGLPNEDSRGLTFDDTNLLRGNRFSGYDRVETGPRVVYGLNTEFSGINDLRFGTFIGQQYRPQAELAAPVGSGIETRQSDVVGRVFAIPHRWVRATYRFQMDDSGGELLRSITSLSLGPPALVYGLSQTRIDRSLQPTAIQSIDQVSHSLATRLDENWRLQGRLVQSLAAHDEGVLLSGATLFYEDDCILLGIDFSRRNIGRAEIPPDTAILFRFAFRNLGELTLR
jgi:LPS-assembly protein